MLTRLVEHQIKYKDSKRPRYKNSIHFRRHSEIIELDGSLETDYNYLSETSLRNGEHIVSRRNAFILQLIRDKESWTSHKTVLER